MLVLVVLVPLFIALYLVLQWRRRRAVARYSSYGLLPTAGRGAGLRRHLPPALFLAGLTILLVSLARPQAVLNLPREEGTVILAFDVSGSMAADDIKPTRMEAAKAAARDFVQSQPISVQIGIVAFSDSGFTVQAPTTDKDAVLATINRLTPTRGTSLAQGILASLSAIAAGSGTATHLYSNLPVTPTPTPTAMPAGSYTSAVVVLLTDGENNENPDPLQAAQAAADRGVRIYTIGLGSAAGTTLHVNGFTVHTQLNEAMLQQISQLTAGAYYNAGNEQDLRTIYAHLGSQLVVKSQKTEVTSILAGASLLVLLTGAAFSLRWFSRMP
jgi:Ca-activated chloride channel family protein